ncbi:MAG TPA: dihydrolipoamide acetyltransferase family protein [Nitrospiria bacterium]|nr:dihydrolipoamide acetyltransferase family protein [Nitrospiria bacterium]
MASRVVMPKLTETMEEGVLLKWYKKEGERVESGDTLAEIETDKAVTDLESYASGILKKVLVPPDSVVPAGDLIAVVADPDEDVTEMVKKEKPRFHKRGEEGKKPTEPPVASAPVVEPAALQREAAPEKREIKASPLAKRLAQERGVDLARVEGTGPGGRITEKDVERHLQGSPREKPVAQPAATHLPALENPFEEIPLTMMRKTIAKRMVQSLAPVPHFYVTTEVEMTEVLRYREGLPEAAPGVKITIGDLIVRAAALALRDFPRLRASFMGEKIRVYRRIDIGIAVGFEEGLTTVVIRDCDRKGLKEISLESRDLIQRAKAKTLKPEEYTGAVFSVSNLGMYDVDAFTAIITPPEAAALAVGSVAERPRIVNSEIAVGKFLRATLSTDHRVADGLTAAEYLKAFKRILQNPLALAL